MKNGAVFGVLCLCVAPVAFADEPEFSFEAGFLASALETEGRANAQNTLFDILLGVENEHLFDNGVALGFRIEGRMQADNKSRSGYAGVFPVSNDAAALDGVASPATAAAVGQDVLNESVRGGVELGFVYVDAPWGEISAGRDIGAATRLDARPPTILDTTGPGSPSLDPSGLSLVRSQNDPTGPSAKISYLTPRWLGVRLGASFTPNVDPDSVDFDPDELPQSIKRAELENAAELALSFNRKFAGSGLRLRAGLNGVFAEAGSNTHVFGDYRAYGAGLELEKGSWSSGLRYLSSNNAADNGDYDALEAAVIRSVGNWRIGVEYGRATDELLGLEDESWSIGASRLLNEEVKLGFAFLSNRLAGDARDGDLGKSNGLVLELTVRNK